jgi:hypothetical protein
MMNALIKKEKNKESTEISDLEAIQKGNVIGRKLRMDLTPAITKKAMPKKLWNCKLKEDHNYQQDPKP